MTSPQPPLMDSLARWFQDQRWEFTLEADNTRLVSGFTNKKGAYTAIWEYNEPKALLSVQLLYPNPTSLSADKILQEINRINANRHPGYFLLAETSNIVLWIFEMFMDNKEAYTDQWARALFSGLAIVDHYYDLFQQEGIPRTEARG